MPQHDPLSELAHQVWVSLGSVHAALGQVQGLAARYQPEVSVLAGLAEQGPDAQADLAALLAPGEVVGVPGSIEPAANVPLVVSQRATVRQFVCEEPVRAPAMVPIELDPSHWAAMLELARLTRPGPFGPRTGAMGRYVGFINDGKLVAMGGERIRFPGYSEISGVCTHPDARGRGHAGAIVAALAERNQSSAEVPFLHVLVGSPSERTAAALYEGLGFRELRTLELSLLSRLEG